MCHLCREEQLNLHVCHDCAVAMAGLGADGGSQGREEFLEERVYAFNARQLRHGAEVGASVGVWCPGLNELGLTPRPGCAGLTEEMPSLEA